MRKSEWRVILVTDKCQPWIDSERESEKNKREKKNGLFSSGFCV